MDIQDVIDEERRTGRKQRWCFPCRWWHDGPCSRATSRPWMDRIELELFTLEMGGAR